MRFQEGYDLQRIDRLLMKFSVEELLRFCSYKPEFKELRAKLPEDEDKKPKIVRRIIEFAENRRLTDILLRWAEERNPRWYRYLEPYERDVPRLKKNPADDPVGKTDPTAAVASGGNGTPSEFEYDVFICHATEDKDDFVDPLAEMLSRIGIRVWYDKFIIEWGDSLSQLISKGLARSRYGIVVLSKHFFRKDWTQYELQGLWSREIGGRKVILPLRHNITKAEIVSFAPTLADKMALDTSKYDLDEIVREVVKMLESGS